MKVNTKISCEVTKDSTNVQMSGESCELFKAACMIVANLKSQLSFKEGTSDADFYKLLEKGVKNAERELKLQKIMEKVDSGEDVLDELFDVLKEVLDA